MDRNEYEFMARAEEAHPWFVNRRRLIRGLVRRFAGHLVRPRVLDAGSGTGVNLADYSQIGAGFGVELDHEAVAMSRLRGCDRVSVGDLCRLPFRAGSFDLVVSTDVIEHVPDDVRALAEMRRVLAGDGRLLITTPAYSWAYSSHDEHLHHVRRYDARRLHEAFRLAGLRVLHCGRYNVVLALPLVLARWFADHCTRGENGSDVGRPVPALASRLLSRLWSLEAQLAERLDLRVGLTHMAVLTHE